MKFKKTESGRSMVEMLGVLAIIGVLSVGGIAGYSTSMRRHRANQILDAASKYAALNYSKCQQKILSGEVTSFILDPDLSSGGIAGCEGSDFPDFTGTDLGVLPAGVKNISHNKIEVFKEGYEEVLCMIVFSDLKLCSAVGSVTGTGCTSNFVSLRIKQN